MKNKIERVAQFERLRAKMICDSNLDDLRAMCREADRSISEVLSKARRFVHTEDLLGQPPQTSGPILDKAKTVIRQKLKLDGLDWWNDPARKDDVENVRRQHAETPTSDSLLESVVGKNESEPITAEYEAAFESLAEKLSEVVRDWLDYHNEHCEFADMQLSKADCNTISERIKKYFEKRLGKFSLDELKSENTKNRMVEDVVEQTQEQIQERLKERE